MVNNDGKCSLKTFKPDIFTVLTEKQRKNSIKISNKVLQWNDIND